MDPASISSLNIAHLLDTGVLILSFALLMQRRILSLVRLYALQAVVLAAAAAWQAHVTHAPHLFVTAFMALTLKGMIIPYVLHRIILALDIHRTVETVIQPAGALMVGIGLVALSIVLVFPITVSSAVLTRESFAIALSVILIGMLIMITRPNAVSQVIGFMSLENGLILAAVAVSGMPLLVEISIAFSVMVAFIIFGIFFFHIRERFESLDMKHLEQFRGDLQE